MAKQNTEVRPVLDLNPIDSILSICLLGYTMMNRIKMADVASMIPIALIQSIIFTWSQHAFFDNEKNKSNPFFRKLNSSFQSHHEDPSNVCKTKCRWSAGTRTHAYYSIPCIIITTFCHRLTKINHMLHYHVMILVIGYLSIRNHVVCHAKNRGYELDFLTKLSHRLRIFPDPEYHSAHHEHLNQEGKPTENIDDCVSCNLYKGKSKYICAAKNSKIAHHKNWAFFIPDCCENTLEYSYLHLLGGPTSKAGYMAVMFLTIISSPPLSPLWFPFVYKQRLNTNN